MVSVLALSINGGIKTVGAYAGIAAVVALALLALLYFAQARELKLLRDWVERESARRSAPPPPVPSPPVVAPMRVAPVPIAPAAPGAAAPVVTTVEGVRRVPIPAGAATEVVPPATPPASPDATTVGGIVPAPEPAAAPVATGATAVAPQVPPTPPLPRLIAESVPGQASGTVHELGDGVLIGRGKVASVRLSDPLASARHARIAQQGEQYVLEDLGSTNGTFLNGVLLSAPAPLSEGDKIRLGGSQFVFATAPDGDGDGGNVPEPPAPQLPPRPAAVPLLATPAPERAIELDHEALGEEPSPVPLPAQRRRLRRPFAHDTQLGSDDAPRLPPPPETERTDGGRGAGRFALLALVVVMLAVVAVVIVELGGGTKPNHTPPAAHSTRTGVSTGTGAAASKPAAKTPSAPSPASVTVAVLNATGRSGLAATVSSTLSTDGYAKGAVADAPASAATTTVGYEPGKKAAALEVARTLGLPASDAVPVTSAAAAAAGTAQVVVSLGSDYRG
ncbi:MAG: FHA domain-containing protein [Solirubrobacteraceae bacterium]|jgi:hypothetical protein